MVNTFHTTFGLSQGHVGGSDYPLIRLDHNYDRSCDV